MTRFTDQFICRPVLVMVVSLLLVVLGVRAYMGMQVREYPKMYNTMITVTTTYAGASADVIEGFITSLLEQSVAGAEGMDYMSSTSTMGSSTIDVYVKVGFDPNVAFTNVNALVQSEIDFLPTSSQQPTVTKTTGSSTATMYVSFQSSTMSSAMISDYIMRVVKPKLFTISGISEIDIYGAAFFSMRVWLNTIKMAALGITMAELKTALSTNDFQSAAGDMKGQYVQVDITAKTDTRTPEEFSNIVVKTTDNTLIRLKDISTTVLGQESYDTAALGKTGKLVVIAVFPTPEANALTLGNAIKAMLPILKKAYPKSLTSKITYDSTLYISASIEDVVTSLWEAIIIIVVVIFLFLGSLRVVLIPIITIPLSLIGTLFLMSILGYTINLMTLLAFVIAVSLVVDDAIVVSENIYRHIEEGSKPFKAAIEGARDIAFPILVMTFTLVAVYVPIGFMTGLTASLFKEFAFTLAGAVVVSGLIALTLSPMMCSKVFTPKLMDAKLVKLVDKFFHRFRMGYQKTLDYLLQFRVLMVIFALFIICNCVYLFENSQSELAPQEDMGALMTFGYAPQYANLDYDAAFTPDVLKIFGKYKQARDYFSVNGVGQVSDVLGIISLIPWDQRPNVTANDIQYSAQKYLRAVPGFLMMMTQPPSLPTGGKGFPISFQIMSLKSLDEVYPYAMKVQAAAKKSGLFAMINSEIFMSRPELVITVDRSKAGLMGIDMEQLGTLLATAMGGNYVNRFNLQDRSYEVIPQVRRLDRLDPKIIGQMRIATSSGAMVPISTIVDFSYKVIPNELTRFQQQNSVQLDGVMMPGHTIGEGINFLTAEAAKLFPEDVGYGFTGSSRQYVQEGDALVVAFGLALILIYLVLAAQFESFRDPFIILIAVPMSVFGAMIPMYLGIVTLNIYTEVGLLTLIGLISKHGILIVQFANDLRKLHGKSKQEAIVEAAGVRLRPVLMTTAAMVFGVLPLVFASGAGSVSRNGIGLVISCGMLVGTCFTLFIVPAFYSIISGKHKPIPQADGDDGDDTKSLGGIAE